MDQYLGRGWFLDFYDARDRLVAVDRAAASVDVFAMACGNGAKDGTPFFVRPDGRADNRINLFWRDPGVRGLALDSQRRYAYSIRVWLNFLDTRGISWDRANRGVLAAFKEWRMSAEASSLHVEASSFSVDLSALNRFYTWAEMTFDGVENPIKYREHPVSRYSDQPLLEASPSGVRRADVKWLTPDAFRLWRDVGLRGFTAEDVPAESWQGLNEDRNAAFADGLYGTGLRCAEWASVLTLEIPPSAASGLTKCQLAGACAKGRFDRPYWLPRNVLQAIGFYLNEGSRPAAVARAQAGGLYERLPNLLLVEEITNHGALVVRNTNGRATRLDVRGLAPADRQRLFKETIRGLEPLALWLNANGLPRPKQAWSKVFADANARVARELTRDGVPPRLWARPHMLRHSFALRWY